MTEEAAERLMQALENSTAAKAVWQSLLVTAAAKGPVTRRLIADALFLAQTSLDFDAAMNCGTEIGDVSMRARDQVRDFRDGLTNKASRRSRTTA